MTVMKQAAPGAAAGELDDELDDERPDFKYEVQWTFRREGTLGLRFDEPRWKAEQVMAVATINPGLARQMPHACAGLVLISVQSAGRDAVTDFTGFGMGFGDIMGEMRHPRLTLMAARPGCHG